MPIYAYRCTTCGHAQDVLQKISDPVLTVCPACGAATYAKQVTAAGFQLKGSGWYVTDFRGGNNAAAAKSGERGEGDAAKTDKPADATAKPAEGAAAAPAAASPAPAAAPAAVPTPPAPSPSSSGS